MQKPKFLALTLVGLLLIAFIAGLSYFAGLATPASYPDMSSLNAGPRGAKLLFESLSAIHPLVVSRNYLPFSQWHPSSSTILLLGFKASAFNSLLIRDLADLEKLAQKNNRLVLAIGDYKKVDNVNAKRPSSIKTRWGVQLTDGSHIDYDASWHTFAGMTDTVEKHFAKGGTVVVALRSSNYSNEQLALEADHQDAIPSLIGQSTSIVFDETHFGIVESGSVVALAWRFHLQGLIAGLLLLVILFIWNQSVSFPPPPRFQAQQDSQVIGASASSMFAGLIARHLSPQTLLESCIAEWNRIKPKQRIIAEMTSKTDPVIAYRQLQETLPKRSRL